MSAAGSNDSIRIDLDRLSAEVAEVTRAVDRLVLLEDERSRRFDQMILRQELIDQRVADQQASIAENSARITENNSRMAEYNARMGEIDQRVAESLAHIAEGNARMAEHSSRMAEIDQRGAETLAQMAESNARMAEQDARINETNSRITSMGLAWLKSTSELLRVLPRWPSIALASPRIMSVSPRTAHV